MSSNNNQTGNFTFNLHLSSFQSTETCRQINLMTDKVPRIPLLRTKMTVNIYPLPIPVPTVYVL